MSDKSSTSGSSPTEDETNPARTLIPGHENKAVAGDVQTSDIQPATQDVADSNESGAVIDVNATFVPRKMADSDNSPLTDADFLEDVTVIGEPDTVDEEESDASGGERPEIRKKVRIGTMKSHLAADAATAKVAGTNADIGTDATLPQSADDRILGKTIDNSSRSKIEKSESSLDGSNPVSAEGNSSGTNANQHNSGFDATLVVGGSGVPETEEEDLHATDPLPGSANTSDDGSISGSGLQPSGSGSKVRSHVWKTSGAGSFDELITIRVRPVSGIGDPEADEFADFEVIEKLAEGGMGIVYVARQKSLNRQLAIKTLKESGTLISGTVRRSKSARALSRSDRQKREMFLSEALVTANLVHPNIIPIHELAETDDGMPYYVMKQVHGIPWDKRIREMSLEENLDVFHKVCDAVAYAHHHGVINRDLKPENIMLGEFGEVLVLDWGLAVPAPHAAEQNFRSPVASFGAGTPAYMSPELWTGPPEAIGECSDIYLLGAILFEMITGHAPHAFPRTNDKSSKSQYWKTIDRVLRENSIRPTKKSGELFDIAMKAMRTNPAERFGSVQEFQFCVRNYERHEQSRQLSSRAIELVRAQSDQPRDYHIYQTATALLEESLRTWAQNHVARSGLRKTRWQYAQLAEARGDYALGQQVAAQEEDIEFVALSKRLSRAGRLRSGIKWTAVAAMLCVALLGAKSIYDHGIITDLDAAKSEAIAAKESADADAALAQQKEKIAKQKADESIAAAAEADNLANLAAVKTREAVAAQADAETAKAEAETAARIAEVEIQRQLIMGLTLNQNYSDALREIDALLSGELLRKLPEQDRISRTAELQAQRAQLEKRTRQSPDPIQVQAVSPDRKLIAFGGSAGSVALVRSPGSSLSWETERPRVLSFDHAILGVQFIDTERLAIASASVLYVWNLKNDKLDILKDHKHTIQAIDRNEDFLLSADESGQIVVRNPQTCERLFELNLLTQLRDIAFIPGTNDFICAGSRGGESTDILAYRLSKLDSQPPQWRRLGQLRMIRQLSEPPQRISISPDGQLLVISNSNNGNLVVLKAEAPSESSKNQFPFQHPADFEPEDHTRWHITGHDRPVNDIEWSQDGMKCLTASDDRTVGVWERSDAADSILTLKTRLRGHGARVTQAHFLDADANWIVSSSADELNRLWDLQTLEDDELQIRNAFHLTYKSPRPDTSHPANLTIHRHYQLTTFQESTEVEDRRGLPALRNPSGAQRDSVDEAEGDEDITLNTARQFQRGSIRSICFAHNDQHLVAGSADGSIEIWDASGIRPVQSSVVGSRDTAEPFHEGHDFNISRMSIIGKSGTLLATSGFDGSLRIWNMDPSSRRMGVQRRVIAGLGLVNTFAASPDQRFLVTSAVQTADKAKPGQCSVWNLNSLLDSNDLVPSAVLSGVHQEEVTAISVSPDSRQIATGGRDGIIAVWNAVNAELIVSLRAHTKNTIITSLSWTADGILVSAGLDGQLTRWRVEIVSGDSGTAGRLTKVSTFPRERTPIERMLVSPDGKQILTLSVETDVSVEKDQVIRKAHPHLDVWAEGAAKSCYRIQLATIQGKAPKTITSADWSADGRELLVCVDGVVQIVETQSWKILRVFSAGPRACTDAQFAEGLSRTAHTKLIVTFDGTIASLWNLENGDQVANFRGPFPVSAVAVMSDGEQDFVIAGGLSLRVFNGQEDLAIFGRPLFRTRDGMASRITSLSVHPTDLCQFAAASMDGTVALWRWHSKAQYAERVQILMTTGSPVSCCRWSADGSSVLSVGRDGVLTICDADGSKRQEISLSSEYPVILNAGEFSQDGRHIVAAGEVAETSQSMGWVIRVPGRFDHDGAGAKTDAESIQAEPDDLMTCRFSGHQAGGITSVSFVHDSPYLVSAGHDGALVLWNWKQSLSGTPPMAYEAFRFMASTQSTAHLAPITALVVSESGRIATSSTDGTISLWQIPVEHKSGG